MEVTPAPAYDEGSEPPPPVPAQQLASWGPRAGAATIDFFVRTGILVACAGVGALAYLMNDQVGEIGLIVGIIVGLVLSMFVYAPLMMARTDGQTVGHRSTHTRVVMADGSRMAGRRAFVREALVKGLLMDTIGQLTLYLLTLVNYLFPLWDPHNETLHDKICRTRVVMA